MGAGGAPHQLSGAHRGVRGRILHTAQGSPRGGSGGSDLRCSTFGPVGQFLVPRPTFPLAFHPPSPCPSGRLDSQRVVPSDGGGYPPVLVAGGGLAVGAGGSTLDPGALLPRRSLPAAWGELHGQRRHAARRWFVRHALDPSSTGFTEPYPRKLATVSVSTGRIREAREFASFACSCDRCVWSQRTYLSQ